KKYITDAETIDDPVALIKEPYPNPDAAYFTTEDLHRIFSPKPDKDGNIPPVEERNPHNLQEDDSVYIFVASSSAQTLSFTQKQFLTETFSLQLSHFRRLQGKQKRQMCLAVGASVKNAYTQLQRSAEQGIKLVVSKTHPSYREETLSLWWELIIAACETIYETHFLPDTAIFSDLLRIYGKPDREKYVPFFSAMSAVVGSEDIGTFAANVGHGYDYWRAVGYAGFPYSLQEMVTRHIRGETTYTSTLRQNFIACGSQSDPYFMRICSHPLDASEMRRHTLLWLLQKSASGGSFDWISSMLGTQNEDMALGAAQILSQMSAPETFRAAIIAMVKNDKTKRDAFSPFEYQRQNPSQWMSIMQQPQEDSGKEKASQDQRYPTLEEYRAQKKHCQSLETKTKKTHAEYRKTSDPNRASQLWKEYKELDSKYQAERKAIEKLNAITHLSDEEWHQIIALLAVNNPRIRWRTAKLVDDFLDDTGRFHLLETIEKLQTIVSKHDMTTATFAAPTLNGKAFTKEEAVAFGFGALSSVLRHNRFSKENKSKALRAIVKLSCEERLPNIAAVLSVAFNDPSEEIRQESFHLALKHRDALGLTQQQIIQQASNAVAFRNAVADSAYRFSYDSLNHLILSELHISGQHEHILRMVSLETHYIARLALELLLKYRDQETREWTYVVPGLAAGLKARSSHVREMIVDAICDCLETKAHAMHKQSEEEREKALQPFWNLLHQALSHGNLDVQNEAASYLRRHKRTEVMPFVYRTYLESDHDSTQKMACRIIKDFKPTGATEKLFARMVNDPLVSANTSYITATIKILNDHSMGFEEKLFEYLPGLLSGQRLSKIGYALLLHFSGIQTDPSQKAPDHTYRPSIVAKIMTFLLQHSQYQRLESCLSLLSQHMEHDDVDEQLASAELDRLLSQLATIRYREGTTDTLRMEALKACGARYISMTPALTSVPKDKQREMPDLAWSNHDWNALRTALDTNLSFHPVVEKKKEEKSPFQYESARILITCQGYIPYAFTVLRSILSLNQYALSWRRNALSLLGPTYSLDLLPTLIELSGMDSRGNEIPANLHRVPEDLKQSAVQMLGYYHNTERSPHILTHLLRLWPKQNLRAQAQWALTNFISYPEYQEAIAALYLDETHAAKWSVRTRDKIEYNGRLHYPVQIFAYSLIELYQQLSQGETSAKRKHLRVSLAKQLEKRLYSSDINAVYAHSLRARDADDVALDIELYQNARAPFLTRANREIMLQRIRSHADAEKLIELMRFALERAGTKTKVESYFEDNKLYDTQKELGFYHLNQIFRICSRDEESIELNMLCRMIQDEESQLSEITKKELSSRLHDHNFSRRGPYFPLYVSKNALFESSPVRWENEVDIWESTIADTADSAEFYRSLLEKEVSASNGLFASLL
ncbi:MAG: hypothetical protein VX278_16090, partial [Myxococcota bacterium]|nr:hypothetical protein [Myxococcota bacterium]